MQLFNLIKQQAKVLAVFLGEALFPVECLGCGRASEWLCPDCCEQIVCQQEQVCHVCRTESALGATCRTCQSSVDGVLVLAHYQGLVKRAIVACKYQFASEIGRELGQLLANFLLEQNWTKAPSFLVPVPLAKKRSDWRGFNQAELLAEQVAELNALTINFKDLVKIKETASQAKLNKSERLASQENVFAWQGESLLGKTVMVVDDVLTTGATLEAVAKTLKGAGAYRVWGLVLARGD